MEKDDNHSTIDTYVSLIIIFALDIIWFYRIFFIAATSYYPIDNMRISKYSILVNI